MSKTIVKLLKQWGSHNPGEVAGFAPHVASKLISSGYAKLHGEPAATEPPAGLSEPTDASEPPKLPAKDAPADPPAVEPAAAAATTKKPSKKSL